MSELYQVYSLKIKHIESGLYLKLSLPKDYMELFEDAYKYIDNFYQKGYENKLNMFIGKFNKDYLV